MKYIKTIILAVFLLYTTSAYAVEIQQYQFECDYTITDTFFTSNYKFLIGGVENDPNTIRFSEFLNQYRTNAMHDDTEYNFQTFISCYNKSGDIEWKSVIPTENKDIQVVTNISELDTNAFLICVQKLFDFSQTKFYVLDKFGNISSPTGLLRDILEEARVWSDKGYILSQSLANPKVVSLYSYKKEALSEIWSINNGELNFTWGDNVIFTDKGVLIAGQKFIDETYISYVEYACFVDWNGKIKWEYTGDVSNAKFTACYVIGNEAFLFDIYGYRKGRKVNININSGNMVAENELDYSVERANHIYNEIYISCVKKEHKNLLMCCSDNQCNELPLELNDYSEMYSGFPRILKMTDNSIVIICSDSFSPQNKKDSITVIYITS